KPEDLTDNANTSTNINDEAGEARFVQNIAASGKKVQIASNAKNQQVLIESEQLMSFLTKADNTLINQSADSSSVRPSPEKLSVEQKAYDETPLLLKASALVADLSMVAKAVVTDEVAVASTTTDKAISKRALVLSDEAKATGKDSAETMIVKSAAESKTGLTSPSKTNVKQINISSDKTNTAPQKLSQPLSVESFMENNEDFSLTAEQIKVAHAQVSNDKTTQDTLPKEVNKADKTGAVSDGPVIENKAINSNTTTQVTNNKQVQVSSLAEPQLTKSELTQNREARQNSEVIKANKMQAKQDEKVQLAASFAEQSQQKPAVQKEDEILIADKVIANVKREPFANSHFIDVSAKATQTPQQIIDQQSVEILTPGVATEITQSQKSNRQLHQEAISLFRKDSAEAVKDKVMLMISQKLQQFDITLDPPELGNIQVRVNLQGEQAVVNFMVQSQQTKDALEQNMHKLRELLAEQGVDVGDANVEQQSQQSANDEDSAAGNNNQMAGEIDNMAEANDAVAHTLSAKMINSSTTSVDYYA
ncbi:MAG: flagellar hook-length control protein FliK, partial [Colwellia sp.]|nr:flagellar hook-length control protein FliK [Colwellia sp.]